MPQLLAIAEYITKTHAICMKCGQPANYSLRISNPKRASPSALWACRKPRSRKDFVLQTDTPTVHS
ncbi:MAG: hypothetical protein ABR568_14745 [Pyrinomonadaceae bacterium]